MSTYNSAKNRQSETRSSAWAFLPGGMHWICDHSAGTIRCNSITLWHLSSIDHGSDVCHFPCHCRTFLQACHEYAGEISRENDLETRIRDWAKENLTVDSLTVDVDTSTTEEMKYFMITELIRERIMHAFPEVQESYADELTENFYNELFS